MKMKQDYIKDITEIRTMMERSSRFLSLTGWSGILAGIYALLGAGIFYMLYFTYDDGLYFKTISQEEVDANLLTIVFLALIVLAMALGTAILLSWIKANKKNEILWNAVARRWVINLAIPLVTGAVFVIVLYTHGHLSLMVPSLLIFYGLALVNASKYTFEEVRIFGLIEIVLGLLSACFIGYGLLFWAIGFGLLHMVYGVYMHLKYER